MELTSNPTSSTSHTQPPTNRTLVQGTNYNQATNHSQGTNLTKPAYQHYPLHHPPVGSPLLPQGEHWIETENTYWRRKNKFVKIFQDCYKHRGESVDLSPRQWQGIEELLLDTCKRFFYSDILRSCFPARSLFILESIGMKRNLSHSLNLRMGNCKKFLFNLNFLSCFAFQLLCNSFTG